MFSKWPNFGYFFPIYGLIKIVINIFSFWLREVNQLVRCLTLKQSLHSHMLKEVALLVFTSSTCTTVIYSKTVTKTFNTICKSNLSTNQVHANKYSNHLIIIRITDAKTQNIQRKIAN